MTRMFPFLCFRRKPTIFLEGNSEQAREIVDRIRKGLKPIDFDRGTGDFFVMLSGGIADYPLTTTRLVC